MQLIPRRHIDAAAWDACVAASAQRIIYGYSWYLDAVLPAPDWQWVGVVFTDKTDAYQAVLPVPLRRKRVLGFTYAWVVHQPLFCQVLGVFSRDKLVNPVPFLEVMAQQFRYGSTISLCQKPDSLPNLEQLRPLSTHILDLSADYETIYRRYTHDRKLNLRRAKAANWEILESTDLDPLLKLFLDNHANDIAGGVAGWAYDIFRNLVKELQQRGISKLIYALHEDKVEAGALFVQEGNRIIYLFNAASNLGRHGNARTLLIDQMIQEKCAQPLLFDFESPEKESIRKFYKSFGANEETFWTWRWNRLNAIERAVLRVKKWLL